jgi:tetratricopeptide (TPR) repeat protein
VDDALVRIDALKKQVGDPDSFRHDSKGSSPSTTINLASPVAILDDVYWLEADLDLKRGEFQKAIDLLQKILDYFGEDILADDAYFLQGEIYEKHLGNKAKAMEIYRDFLNRFPGSVHAAEARKRFRVLRGDFSDQSVNN